MPIPYANSVAVISTVVRVGGDVYELLLDDDDDDGDALKVGSHVLALASQTLPQGPALRAATLAKDMLDATT